MVETRTGKRTDGATSKTLSKPATKKVKDEKPSDASIKHSTGDAPGRAPAGDKHTEKPESDAAGSRSPKLKKRKSSNADDSKYAHQILEKGNIYFFYRARVGVDHPKSAVEIARSFIVLRPDDEEKGDCRLIALPKKKLPRSGHDRFMAILLNAHVSYDGLHSFLGADMEGDDEESNKVSVAFGEGVYALVSTAGGRESHLVYSLTVPSELGPVQQELGLGSKKGCFIVSTKNPEFPMPINAKMVHGGPEYSDDIKARFHGRRWAPLQPEHLEYDSTYILLVGESHGAEKILAEQDVAEELEELADADLDRMRRLGSTEAEAVFASLGVEHVQPKQELVETFK
ncbi:hypothetical protein F503_03394 [Ophiostoma piceae UAMH 11346]|uniref:BTB domain transcription factor n=1 Tax=Ophiostoma piceae (strain UAMH 11346) TaxID=1262450 RepID=S3C2G6_OPHP1|nr:hypothetical protein F503_03394 [Ophiostoma piceae UAMH 11346]